MSAPGIGRRFAERLHAELAISTLEDLEAAAYDGRLATVAGFGDKRLAGIRDTLAHRLGRARRHSGTAATAPPVTELLDVDRATERRRLRPPSEQLRHAASILVARPGFQCFTRRADTAAIRHCFPILLAHTNSARPGIGSSSTATMPPAAAAHRDHGELRPTARLPGRGGPRTRMRQTDHEHRRMRVKLLVNNDGRRRTHRHNLLG